MNMKRAPGMPTPPTMGSSLSSKMTDTGDPWGLKVGVITRVDELHMKADLKILTGGGDQYEVDLTQSMAGPRSFWGGVPEEGSLVLVGYRRKHKQVYQAVILGYLPQAQRAALTFDPISPVDPTEVDPADVDDVSRLFGDTIRYRRLKLRPGDVGGLSKDGAEFSLTKDVKLYNRAGDYIEIRDSDRTFISQSVHRVESTSGVYRISGPVRRSHLFLPSDIFQSDGVTLITETNRYFGSIELQNTGPDPAAGGPNRYANSSGKVLGLFNNQSGDFPPVTYSNGKRSFFPSTVVGASFEDPEAGGLAYTEHRVEISHTTDTTQEVRDETDGFQIDRPRAYIEQVFGTIVGNDAFSSRGLRQYGRILKPTLFPDVVSMSKSKGKFDLHEVPRSPTEPDIEVDNTACAYLFRITPPSNQQDTDTQFVYAVSKQGKVFLNIPGSKVERYPSGSKNVSVEANLEGAFKAFVGAETVYGASIIADLAGGIRARIGHLANGRAIDVEYGSLVKQTFTGSPADNEGNGIALDTTVQGNENKTITGDHILAAYGAVAHTANGGYSIKGDSVSVSGQGGYTGNFGGMSITVTDKTTYNYALQVTKNILAGGEVNTIVAGGLSDTILAGARSYTTTAGVTTFNNPGGAFSITVGTGAYSVNVGGGAISMTASAAVSVTAGGTMALTSSGPMTLTSSAQASIVAPLISLGGPPAVLGVCRGTPMQPPGSPSLDWVTGLPLQGSAVVTSI